MSGLYLSKNHQSTKDVDLDARYINQNYPEKLNFDLDLNQNKILNASSDSDILTKQEAGKLESKINKSIVDKIDDNKKMIQDNKKFIEENYYTKNEIDKDLERYLEINNASMENNIISNIKDGVNEKDAINKSQLDKAKQSFDLSLSSKIDLTSLSSKIDKTEVERDYLTKASFTLSESAILNNQSQTNNSINDLTSAMNNKIDKNTDINLGLHKIRNLENGSLDLDSVNKGYIDQLIKEKCKLVSELNQAEVNLLKTHTQKLIKDLRDDLNKYIALADSKFVKPSPRPKRSDQNIILTEEEKDEFKALNGK